jgi:hypothetical protein
LAQQAGRITVITSAADNRLKLAPLSRRTPHQWAAVLAGFSTASVLATMQAGHGAQCYLGEILDGRWWRM